MNDSTSSSAKPKAAPVPAEQHVRFRLAGPATPFDAAHQAIRPDLADIAEAAHHFAPHYARPVTRTVTRAAPLLEAGAADAAPRGALSAGEAFALLDVTGDWAWGYRISDHLVGFVAADALTGA